MHVAPKKKWMKVKDSKIECLGDTIEHKEQQLNER